MALPKSTAPTGEEGAPKKKKAPPPPSGAPPKSAAAALRAKAGPPSSPPPKGVNAAVQKIRAGSAGETKAGDENAPPKPKKKVPPPSAAAPSTPRTNNDVRGSEEKDQLMSARPPSADSSGGVPSTAPPKPKKKPPPKDVLNDMAMPPRAVEAKDPLAQAAVDNRSNVQHIVASEKKAILETIQGKPRKTTTELLQEDAAFKRNTTAMTDEGPSSSLKAMYSSVSSNTAGKAAPQSMTMRREHAEEELTVRKAVVVKKNVADAKAAAALSHDDLDDSMDDIEDIPILETMAADAKGDDDPEIVMEKAPCDDKVGAKHGIDDDDRSDAVLDNNSHNAPIPATKAALADALYHEMKQLETLGKATVTTSASNANDGDNDGKEAKQPQHEPSDSGDAKDEAKPLEPKKRSKKSKQHAEDKKKSFEYFNPKRVPYVPNQLLNFITKPLEVGRGHIVRCFIERNRSGQNKLSPLYSLMLEVSSATGRPLMYARKKPTSRISSHYIFSLNKDDLFLSRSLRSKQFVGKLRSDTRKMEYTLFDQGDNPEDIDSDCEIDDEVRQHIRAQMATIRYHPTKKEFLRKMEVIVPAIVEHESGDETTLSYLDWRPISKDQTLEALFTEVAEQGGQNVLERDKFTCLHKRESQYDPLSSCIVDFRSRATSTSIKNFQLVHSQPTDQEKYRQAYIQAHPTYHYDDESTVSVPQEHIILQMGRVGMNCFNMDFQYPLSMLQAFAICISRFDTKQK
ncbi:hypothetical protein H310_11818 [Aphanomyces invadans]|uniref:Tubby C-terminal domain-containing protein n=1 Tax=Aphanomyces invadans TaxID=157072 RepID=A0A024TKE8_9STRA|nr:hypothetical protein H310_11818 [Aphanomyces invadans]ETV94508.1 hypothetical protein H310_11818 [Aphanomyces invadans]|eukprot:XP_008876823.1 hypothetical protein H310_11818 [Aphanomyces invadans]